MQLYKRGDVWHGAWYDHLHRRVRRSTGCTDKKAAESRVRQWERDAADPHHAAARDATLSQAVVVYLAGLAELVAAGKRSADTRASYTTKAGHLLRLFEHSGEAIYAPLPLVDVTASRVDDYISRRRAEGVTDHTIHKELVVLRNTLRAAKRKGLWRGDLDAVLPPRFSTGYRPRTRFLTRDELDRLLGSLRCDRAAVVAFIVATSAEWSAVGRARRDDIAADQSSVLLRGSKNAARTRAVPIVSDDQRRLLTVTLAATEGRDGALFAPWGNARRELHAACDRAGIAPCSPHDLRRTFASWMIQDGVAPHLIAKMMGHRTSRMVELVYAQLRPDDLAALVRAALGRAA